MMIAELTEQELKSNLIKQLDSLTKKQLVVAHQLISQLLLDEVIADVTHDWETGKVNHEMIQQAIKQHRARHPYR